MATRLIGRALMLALLSGTAYAQTPGVEPGRLENRFEPPPTPRAAPEIVVPGPEAAPPPAEAEQTRFLLAGVTIEGSTVYQSADFEPLYQALLSREVSLADVYALRDAITARYRADGYILSQAIVPAQHISDGVVRLQVIEGYIDQVTVEGDTHDARSLTARTAEHITRSRPLRMHDLERYVLLIDDMPGVSVSTVLRPSPTAPGAADLVLDVSRDQVAGYVAADNRGSRAIGPEEFSAKVDFNSILGLGEQTSLFYASAADTDELQYVSVEHAELLGTEGVRLSLGGSWSRSRPGDALSPLEPLGNAETYRARITAPLIRTRSRTLQAGLSFMYLDSTTDLIGVPFSEDRVRFLSADLSYDFADTFFGDRMAASTLLEIGVHQGFDILDATETGAAGLTRANGHSDFTTVTIDATRVQSLASRTSAMLAVSGQLAGSPLLSSQQFGLGGAWFGRGYEPSELTGDDGLAASVELRFEPPFSFPDRPQLYAFYDAGTVWLHDPLPGEEEHRSLTSAGVGFRFAIGDHVTAAIELAKPLTRDVASRGDRDLRPLFSLTTSF